MTSLGSREWADQQEHLSRLESATRYPSILTYHAMDNRGRLSAELAVDFGSEPVFCTEKIDGTNLRIIFCEEGTFVASRKELLHRVGERIANPALGMVDAAYELELFSRLRPGAAPVTVFYGELYGVKATQAHKAYSDGRPGFRLFDVLELDRNFFELEIRRIAAWRDNGGQPFVSVERLATIAEQLGVERVPQLSAEAPPQDLAGTQAWALRHLPESQAVLVEGASKRPEGIVVRTGDRKRIAKIRFEDYQRALR
ncbi:MAG: RNA ligase family protein [Polyangiaceae bacterium]